MHRDPGHLHLADLGEHRADALGGRTADGSGDHHHLGAIHLTLDDVAQLLRIGVDDADAVHLGARIPARRGKRIRVDVVDLAVAGGARYVDQLAADAHHRQPRPRMDQHAFAADGGQQTDLRGADDRARPHRDVAGLDIVTGATDVGAGAHRPQHPHPRLPAVGPPQRQHRIGQRRHRRAGLHTGGLSRLQPARRPRARLDGAHHGQADLLIARAVGRSSVVVVVAAVIGVTPSTSTLRTA